MNSSYIPIEHLLTADRLPNSVVAQYVDGTTLHWDDWRQRVAGWCTFLAGRDEQRWALYSQDCIEFSVVLFALWATNKTIYLAGDNQPDTQRLLNEQVQGFIGGFDPAVVSHPVLDASDAHASSETFDSSAPLDVVPARIMLFTSGSTGVPVLIEKSFGQLSREVTTLDTCWGEGLRGASVISTVSHLHIYGLLFRLLWPLAAGMPFQQRTCQYTEDILLAATGSAALVLVSSPSHLARLPAQLPWDEMRSRLRAVFSSAAPLSYEAAQVVHSRLLMYATEVFGSSETGGIGWRQQRSVDEPWQLFAGVRIKAQADTQRLELQSPNLQTGDWWLADDLVELVSADAFHLRGRIDTIVKIEGKRVSLTALERYLTAHPFVLQARVIDRQTRRDASAALVVLNVDGLDCLQTQGKRALNQLFTEHLLQHVEAVVVPKHWRFLTRMPNNQQGKTPRALLDMFFEEGAGRRQLPRVSLFDNINEQTWEIAMYIPDDLLFFDGHFTQSPILPGMAMIFWVEHYARVLFQVSTGFANVRRLKFQKVVRPQQALHCTLTFLPSSNSVSFRYQSDIGIHSSGTMRFQPS